MKKVVQKIVIVLLLAAMLIPSNVLAQGNVSIKNSSVTGENIKNVGENLSLTFTVNFTGMKLAFAPMHIVIIGELEYELIYDESALELQSVSSDTWESKILSNNNGKARILSGLSDLDENITDVIEALDQLINLYGSSGTMTMKLNFLVKDTKKTETEVKFGDATIRYMEMTEDDIFEEEIEEESLVYETDPISLNQSKTITIKGGSTTSSETPSQTPSVIPSETQQPSSKSSNNNLSLIKIDNHPINFKKEQLEYNISVNHDTKKLNIRVEAEDKNATYVLKGADDLKEEVQIIVKAENGDEKTYIIKVTRKEEDNKAVISEEPDKKDDVVKEDSLKKVTYITILVALGVIIIAIICLLISHHNKNKLYKMFDEMMDEE